MQKHNSKQPPIISEIYHHIITNNQAMLSLFEQVSSIAKSGQPVLITGETGVGKELFAQAVHRASELRGDFVAVNVAGLDDNSFSDTLFGHLKGAFTGADRLRQGMIERAQGGTLFLDEIGDLSTASQVKLLRLLQENEYLPLGADIYKKSTARIVTATNRDLWSFQKTGRFRSDLNYRLRTHHINVPPLRERAGDISTLIDHFLSSVASILKKKTPTPPKELLPLLAQYHFPGNIRELQSMIFDAVSRHESKVMSLQTFHEHIARNTENNYSPATDQGDDDAFPIPFTNKFPTIEDAVRMLVIEAMKQAQGNQAIAAKLLGISRQALNKRLKKIEGVAGKKHLLEY
nr:sigma-54-dependent Fis family transcriptional regulator [Desulfobulbaceae bacterium]